MAATGGFFGWSEWFKFISPSGIKAPKNGYVYVYVSNQSNQDVYFDNLAVSIAQGNIIEENHYYSFGLKIAAISSKKFADSYDGQTKNNYQMQGSFSEMDDDISAHVGVSMKEARRCWC